MSCLHCEDIKGYCGHCMEEYNACIENLHLKDDSYVETGEKVAEIKSLCPVCEGLGANKDCSVCSGEGAITRDQWMSFHCKGGLNG